MLVSNLDQSGTEILTRSQARTACPLDSDFDLYSILTSGGHTILDAS